jgi:hypothetical protein
MYEILTTSFWHTDAVGGRPHHQPQALVVWHAGNPSLAQQLSFVVMGPRLRGDDTECLDAAAHP